MYGAELYANHIKFTSMFPNTYLLTPQQASVVLNISVLFCLQVYLFYLLEYPLGKQIEHQLTFLVSQLSFELQPGRISTLETLQGLINAMPVQNLSNHAGLLFVAVAARLINDDSPECRKIAANFIKSLLHKIGHNGQEELFGATLLWFKDKKVSYWVILKMYLFYLSLLLNCTTF